ncbi:MAG: hypothetical protein AAF664_19140 [Planctomycetota bacterium]
MTTRLIKVDSAFDSVNAYPNTHQPIGHYASVLVEIGRLRASAEILG